MRCTIFLAACVLLCGVGCSEPGPPPGEGITAFTGATVFDGDGASLTGVVLLVRDGRVQALGPASEVPVPEGAEQVDLSGRYITPGLINGHGHVGQTQGLENADYGDQSVLNDLGLYARYGVTTVASLGGDGPEAVALRDAQNASTLDRARIYVSGAVVTADTPEGAREEVNKNADMKVDFIKIRVDDNLGTSKKMTPEVFQAVIDQAHQRGLPLAAHLYYLDDAKALLQAGADFIAHSVRDKEVDQELIDLLKTKNICLCPTLTREVSTFAYETVPEFFSDSFFLREADAKVLEELKTAERQTRIKNSKSAQQYKKALVMASANLKKLFDAGVKIAMGTDTGPPARFQGYFEHMEMDLMVKAGLTPEQVLTASTANVADCLKLQDVGRLEAGKWADFVVYTANPLDDIANTKTIESVWIAGSRVPGKPQEAVTTTP
jgi:imidazolonepropionase-like amidohydrolase